ncbi:uncharacterized protein [Diadema setosum]|uniref:uncharacterized protein n=1 Tax=Diadema setosum TaxID=31175 RepID=UPI003B3BAA10
MDRMMGLSTSALTLVILLSQYATWSGATCPAPSVDHSLVAYDNEQQTYDSETRLTLECKFSDKSIEVFCNGTTGQWEAGSLSNADREFQCPANPALDPHCGKPDVDSSIATYNVHKDIYADGSRITVSCKYSSDSTDMYCDGDNGVWRFSTRFRLMFTCSPRPCSPPNLDSDQVALMGTPLASYSPGSHVTLECKYTGKNLTVQCERNGGWTSFYCPKDPAMDPHCGKPDVDSSVATYNVHKNIYADGTQITVSCKYSSSSADIYCDGDTGEWTFSSWLTYQLLCPTGCLRDGIPALDTIDIKSSDQIVFSGGRVLLRLSRVSEDGLAGVGVVSAVIQPAGIQLALLLQIQAERDAQLALIVLALKGRRRRRHRWWVKLWLTVERRLQYGQYETLMQELSVEDVTPDTFDEILQRVTPRIQKKNTRFRSAIPAGLKLAVTLRYLATGDTYTFIAYDFRTASETICHFIPKVCDAIADEYKEEVLSCPLTPQGCLEVADQFERKWNIPHAVGALDGKHIAIKKPANSGSLYNN